MFLAFRREDEGSHDAANSHTSMRLYRHKTALFFLIQCVRGKMSTMNESLSLYKYLCQVEVAKNQSGCKVKSKGKGWAVRSSASESVRPAPLFVFSALH